MQSFETYGFKIDFDNHEAYKYLDVKDAIERLCKNSIFYSKQYNKPFLIQYAPLKNNAYITCAVINNKAEFGIYDRKYPNIILQSVSDITLNEITIEKINLLQDIMEITAQNKTNVKINPLYNIWIEHFKEKQIYFDLQVENEL